MKKYADAFVILAGVLWGLVGPVTKCLRDMGLDPLQISALRWVFSGIIMFFGVLIIDKNLLKVRIRDLWWFVCTGILCVFLGSTLYFVTMPLATTAVANILMYTSPVWIMLFSIILFKERITLKKVVSLILAVVGCAFATGALNGGGFRITPLGIITGLFSGLFYGLYSIFGKFVLKKYDTITVTLYTVIFSGIGALFTLNFAETPAIIAANPTSLIYLATLVILMSIAPYTLYTLGLKHTPATRASIFSCIEPVTSAIMGTLVMSEPFSLNQLVGIIMILAAGLLLQIKNK